MTAPKYGTTKLSHVEEMLAGIDASLADLRRHLHGRLPKATREELNRRLAGSVGNLEGIRIWLGAGAPR